MYDKPPEPGVEPRPSEPGDHTGQGSVGKCKYEKMKSTQASTDGATIDRSRYETDIAKHSNKHVNFRDNFKVGPTDSRWALTSLTI